MNPVNVLIVDDSALVRRILFRGLSADPHIRVVGTAGDALKAQKLIHQMNPDVLTLDIEMPGVNGLDFLKQLMRINPLPVIMVSALTERGSKITLEALASGAVDFILKPSINIKQNLAAMLQELRTKVKMAAQVNVRGLPVQKIPAIQKPESRGANTVIDRKKIIAIGASTGGTEAIRFVLKALPPAIPGVVVVQHMPAGFTAQFARSLNAETQLDVKEARSGDRVLPGKVLIAPGDFHLQLIRDAGTYRVVCRRGARVNGYRPSVDVLFRSVARYAGAHAIGVLMTGMGDDGADAMVKLRAEGALTIAQDKETSVVFGMPKEAYLRGGVSRLLPLNKIPGAIMNYLNGNRLWPN